MGSSSKEEMSSTHLRHSDNPIDDQEALLYDGGPGDGGKSQPRR